MDIKSRIKGLPTLVFNINIGNGTSMPSLRKVAKKNIRKKVQINRPKQDNHLIQRLLDRVRNSAREKVVYVKDGSQHIGGSV